MTSYIQETIDILRRDGISYGWGSEETFKPKCLINALSSLAKPGFKACSTYDTAKKTLEDDCRTIREVLHAQYPHKCFGIGRFNDTMVAEGRQEEIFTVLEKAAVLRQEKI